MGEDAGEEGSVTEASLPGASPRADASQGFGAPVDAAPDLRTLPPRIGIGGSTRGTIACGSRRCAAERESCVRSLNAWRCVSQADVASGAIPVTRSLECDDRSDCPQSDPQQGNTCCVSAGARDNTRCNPRYGVDSDPCSLEVCNTDPEAASCPKGQACIDGGCRPPQPRRASCAKGALCPASAPVCSWKGGVGICVARAEQGAILAALHRDPQGAASALECTRNADCGPGPECCIDRGSGFEDVPGGPITEGAAVVTACRLSCDHLLFESVCEKGSDCPPFFVTGDQGGSRPQRCTRRPPSASYPAWLGECELGR